jgi:hypothetical protein
MNNLEKQTVKTVAKVAPWLAPLPSAYFVARAAMEHLSLPLAVAIIAAAIIETLGLSTVHTALWLSDYNAHKRKSDPHAPTILAVALGAVYVAATLGLVVFLEVWQGLATYAPALFPVLAVVGAVNLALIAQQERREAGIEVQKAEAREKRKARKRSVGRSVTGQLSGQPVSQVRATDLPAAVVLGQNRHSDRTKAVSLDTANRVRRSGKEQALTDLLTFYAENPGASYRLAGQAVDRSKSWVVGAVAELETAGKVRKNGHGVEVLEVRG